MASRSSVVVQIARFGDLVQTGRLVLSLAERGDVHLVVEEDLVPLASAIFPSAIVHGLRILAPDAGEVRTSLARLQSELRDADADAVYNANFSPLSAALCRGFPPEIVHGYRPYPGGVAKSSWVRLAFALTARRRHASLNLVDFWGRFAPDPIAPERVNPVPHPGGKGVAVVLAGQASPRSLPVGTLGDIVATVFRGMEGPRLTLLGTKTQQPLARGLLRHLPARIADRTENLCGRTDWPGLVAALQGLDAAICPDTGVMHLAARLGVPVLAFFLASAWCHETGPYGVGHHVWQAQAPCAPCLESRPCPRAVSCAGPFAARDLLRSVTSVVTGGKPADPGEGLSLWKSRLDALGCLLEPLAGIDDDAARRGIVREVLGYFAGLGDACAMRGDAPDAALRESVYAMAYRDADVALPKWRYV